MKGRLTLRREAVAELTNDDLAAIAGGTPSGVSCPLADCFPPRTGYSALDCVYTALDCVTRGDACLTNNCS